MAVMAVAYKIIYLGLNTVLLGVIFSLEFLGIVDHTLDVFLGETSLVVGDGDLILFTGRLVGSRDVEDTVGIDVEGDFDLWNTTWCWWDASQIEFTKDIVVLGHGTFTFEDLEKKCQLKAIK